MFSEVPVSERSRANEMGAGVQPVHLNCDHPQPVRPRRPRDCEHIQPHACRLTFMHACTHYPYTEYCLLQLTVTVTPGLPPLLPNESYWCRFADGGGGRMITVDADEVTPNTEYTCNISERVPPFTGVQLGELSVYNHTSL